MPNNLIPDDLPRSSNHVFVSIVIVACLCCIFYWLDLTLTEISTTNPEIAPEKHTKILQSVLENLIAGSIAAILLALTYRKIIAILEPTDRVIEIPSNTITNRLISNTQKTRSYIFIGNTASFVTASALPVLIDSMRKSGHQKSITMFLADPRHKQTISNYTEFKSRLALTASKVADQHLARWVSPEHALKPQLELDVKAKILSALYLAAFTARQSGMTVAVYLRRSFTPLRADITDQEVVLTQESKKEAAVAFSSRGEFYSWYQKEADAQKGQSIFLDFSADRRKLQMLVHPSENNIAIKKSLISFLKLYRYLAPFSSNEDLINKTVLLLSRPSHNYEP